MPTIAADPLDQQISGMLRALRQARDITQSELAGQVGISFQQLQKYERGMNRIPALRLWRLAEALKVPVETFFAGPDQGPKPAGATGGLLLDRSVMQAALALSQIESPERRATIARILTLLAAAVTPETAGDTARLLQAADD